MSYKITLAAWAAFKQGRDFRNTNTVVKIYSNNVREMYLYNTCIARYCPDKGTLSIQTGGWDTATTKERLRACPIYPVEIKTKKGQMYLNGLPWNGTWTALKLQQPL